MKFEGRFINYQMHDWFKEGSLMVILYWIVQHWSIKN